MGKDLPADFEERVAQATAFLRFLVQGCDATHVISILEIQPTQVGGKRVTPHFYFAPAYELAAHEAIKAWWQNRSNLYVQCTLLSRVPPAGRGTREMVAGGNVLWVDADAEASRPLEAILADLKHFQPAPSWANISGGGVHAYWRLEEFCADIPAIEGRNRWLMRQLGRDGCWDATHVLRLPGTQNFKTADRPREVVAVDELCSKTEYTLDVFPTSAVDNKAPDAVDVTEEPLPEDFLQKIPSELAMRIQTGPIERGDRSANDWFIARKLMELGFTPGQALTVLTHPEWYSGEKARSHGYQYPIYTIRRAVSEHTARYVSTRIELQPVIDSVLITVDDKGMRRKVALMQGSELVVPAVRHLEGRGYRFCVDSVTQEPYVVSPQGDVVSATSGTEYERWIYQVSGFTAEEREHRVLRSGLQAHTREYGDPVKLGPWCLLDGETNTSYVMLDSAGRDVLRTPSGGNPEVVPNGTDGVILQKSSLVGGPLKWAPAAVWQKTMRELVETTTRGFATSPELAGVLTCYMLAAPIVYGSPVQMYPMLHITGPAGYGKSQTAGVISTFLHGRPELLSATTLAAAYRMASREIWLPFDDYERLPLELKQFILTSATGATRRKSGAAATDTVGQETHVMLGLTSISPLEDIAARRRAFVVNIDKSAYRVPNYTDTHWHLVAARRSSLWSGYARWLGARVLPLLTPSQFMPRQRRVLGAIQEGTFGGLASFMTLMWAISDALSEVDDHYFPAGERQLHRWLGALQMDTADEIADRDPLDTALQEVLEVAKRGPEGEMVLSALSRDSRAESYNQVVKVVHTIMRSHNFRLRPTPHHKLPTDVQNQAYFGLEGSMTEWAATLSTVTRGKCSVTPAVLGSMFANMLGKHVKLEDGQKESEPINYRGAFFVRLHNAGVSADRWGWRMVVPVRGAWLE